MKCQARITYGNADVQFHEYSNLVSLISAINWYENEMKRNNEVSQKNPSKTQQ